MRYRAFFAAGLTLALLGTGCSGMESGPYASPVSTPPASYVAPQPATNTVKPKTVTVEMKDDVFSPQIIAINPGDTVLWKNVGKHNHTSTGLDQPLLWDSGNLAPGKTYSRTFNEVGKYDYHCSIHPNMKGQVVVGQLNP